MVADIIEPFVVMSLRCKIGKLFNDLNLDLPGSEGIRFGCKDCALNRRDKSYSLGSLLMDVNSDFRDVVL